MCLVADETCDFSVVVGVRSAGHDVIAIAELMSGVDDGKVIDLAASERRLLLTEDKDFGQLVFAAAKQLRSSDERRHDPKQSDHCEIEPQHTSCAQRCTVRSSAYFGQRPR